MSIIVDGETSKDIATAVCTAPAPSRAPRHADGEPRLVQLGRARIGAPVHDPGQRHEHRRRDVEAHPDPERDVLRDEAVEVREGRDRHEDRERRDRQNTDVDAMKLLLHHDAGEETGAGGVPRPHDHGVMSGWISQAK
jgi:hypothetical protein